MKKIVLLIVVLLVSVTAGPAFAKDLCVGNAFGQLFKFDKVQLLKGKTTTLAGRWHPFADDTNTPVTGAVTLDSDNSTTRIAIISYPVGLSGVAVAFSEYMIGDKSFNATGTFDNSPFSGDDGSDVWTAVDCKTIVPPASPTISPVGPAPGLPQ
jgi:hypothetical protein